MHIYLHRLTVTVITSECSPDAIERLIDKAGADCGMHVDARTDPANRMRGPSIAIANPPEYPKDPADKAAIAAWATAHDLWRDSWPTVDDFQAVEG